MGPTVSQFPLLEVLTGSVTLENSLALHTKVSDIFIVLYDPAMCARKHVKMLITVSQIHESIER